MSAPLAFAAGVVTAAAGGPLLLAVLFFGLLLRKPAFLALLLLALALLGFWRFESSVSALPEAPEGRAAFQGVAASLPKNGQVEVLPEGRDGRILLFVSEFADIQEGDTLFVEGEVQKAPVFDDFDYRAFLADRGVAGVMVGPEVEIQGRASPGALERMRQAMRLVIDRNLAAPSSELLSAMLLGDKGRMGDELKEELNRSGLRHVTAISGLHVAVLAQLLMGVFVLALSRKTSSLLVAVGVLLFVALTGFQASAVRAGLMGGVALWHRSENTRSLGLRNLVWVAAAMLAVNPLLVRDAGFELSVLAVLGILLFSFEARGRLSFVTVRLGVRDVLAVSFAAQVFTLPVLLWQFGGFSVVALAANLLVVPLLPFILVAGFAGVAGALVGIPFSLVPSALLLEYVGAVASLFSSLPFAFLEAGAVSWGLLLLLYAVLGGLWWRKRTSLIY